MRRLRAGFVTPHSGGPGAPLGRHYGRSARSFAGLGAVQWFPVRELSVPAVEAALETWTGNRTANQETRARGQKSRDGAPRGARTLQKRVRQDGKTGAPLGAPSPRLCREEKEEDGVPGAAKNTGGGALACRPKRSEGGLFEI